MWLKQGWHTGQRVEGALAGLDPLRRGAFQGAAVLRMDRGISP